MWLDNARDRLGLTEHLLGGFRVSVVCTGRPEGESAESGLVRGIVISLAGRLDGQCCVKTKRWRAAVGAETGGGDGR